jgi:hypothetical protein
VEVEAGVLVTTTESVTTVKMRNHALPIAVVTIMEVVNLAEEKMNIHVRTIVDVTTMEFVNLAEGKTIQHAEIAPVAAVVERIVVAMIHALVAGWAQVVVNILNEDVTTHKVQFGMERTAHVPLDKSVLKGIAETRMKKTVYRPEVLHGMIGNTDVYVRVNI